MLALSLFSPSSFIHFYTRMHFPNINTQISMCLLAEFLVFDQVTGVLMVSWLDESLSLIHNSTNGLTISHLPLSLFLSERMHSTWPLSCLQAVFRSASDIPSLSEAHKSRFTLQIFVCKWRDDSYSIWCIFQPGLFVCGMINVINHLINQRSCISSQTGYVNLLPVHVKIFLTWKTMAFQASIYRGQQLLVRDDPSIYQTQSWQGGMWFDAAKPKYSIIPSF